MDLVDILIAIALIIASVLGLYLIKLIKRLFTTLDIVDNKVKELDEKLTPLLYDLQKMIDSGNTIANFAKEQTDYANDIIVNVKNKFGGFFVRKSDKASPQSNAHNLITNLRAIFKATTSFINELK
ncbi:MAG: DUF948 domain-containing protein [Bacteroidetes bacterium]|nr:DUF948 domain-containing protein [Bacteroidota bacterium]MBU1113889.1 DUF948 domain-containing protein [Bacteroidota bacterium]MBU1798085.1 DUF948 domain-containing protein [Bacteroidota bacterium]